jgi:protein-L-isoaspartate(D-aspartate) O-methyltransferase
VNATLSPAIVRAMRAVPRSLFVPPAWRSRAGVDEPLPIGFGQTISQPSLVAWMIDELAVDSHSRVLEIGTGSGYETALLACLVGKVFTIERLPVLAEAAEARLRELHFSNIHFKTGDGSAGWPEAAPFDAIIVTAAASAVPPALVEQTAPGGRLVIPIGPVHGGQVLLRLDKDADGAMHARELCAVRFVPLVSDAPMGGG